MKGITFIGMAGAGKSAVGKIAAQMLGWKFLDLDKLLLATEGIDHHEYMRLHGDNGLIAYEEQLALGLNFEDTLFSPPGSMVYSQKTMEKIKNDTLVVYLRTTPEIIVKRQGDRLYKNGIIGLVEKGLPKLMAERGVLYEKYADYTFDSAEQSPEEMAKKVIDGLIAAGINLSYAVL